MLNQFIKNYVEFENEGLNPTEVSVLSHLYDYGNLSVKNNWIKNGMVFVKYLRESLANQINVSKETITRTVQALENKGWIIAKRQRNAATVYFLPKYEVDSLDRKWQIDTLEMANCNKNQTYSNHTNNTFNTVNTEKVDKKVSLADELKKWEKTTKEVVGITGNTLESIKKFCNNNILKCKYVVRLILNARNVVAKKHKLAKTKVSQFESNLNIKNNLNQKVQHVFSYLNNKDVHKNAGYIVNSFKEFFEQSFGIKKQIETVKPNMYNQGFKGNNRQIKETLPEWAKDDYVYVPDKNVDLKKQAELKAMLADL